MTKVFGVVVAAVMLATSNHAARVDGSESIKHENDYEADASSLDERQPIEIPALLAAARGAPKPVCALAANSLRNWGGGNDAPATPLGISVAYRREDEVTKLSDETINLLLSSLSSDDPCVRELAVRLVARRNYPAVTSALIAKLSDSAVPTREVAALGLGLADARDAIQPLIRSLRDG